MIKFNKERYLELLVYSKNLEAKSQHLSEVSKSDYEELSSYSVELWEHLEWEFLSCYLSLIRNYLKDKICIIQLINEIETIQNSIEEVLNVLESNLVILSPNQNPNANLLGELIGELNHIFDQLTLDSMLSLEEIESLIKENKYDQASKEYDIRIHSEIKRIYTELEKFLDN